MKRHIHRTLILSVVAFGFSASITHSAEHSLDSKDPKKTQIGGHALELWLDEAQNWFSTSYFPGEIKRFSEEIVPPLIDCFEQARPNSYLGQLSPNEREELRYKAMLGMLALEEEGASAIPRIRALLDDRNLEHRQMLVNCVSKMGPRSFELAQIGIEDTKSDDEKIRQQGVILLAASANYNKSTLALLIKATDDKSTLVRRTAIDFLLKLQDASPEARTRIQEMHSAKGDRTLDSGYISTFQRFRKRAALRSKDGWIIGR